MATIDAKSEGIIVIPSFLEVEQEHSVPDSPKSSIPESTKSSLAELPKISIKETPQKTTPDLVQKHKSSTKIIFHAIIACMGPFYFGFALGELNMALPTLNLMYGMDEMAISQDIAYGMLTGAMNLGGFFGCLVAGDLIRRFSRRTLFYACDIAAIIVSCIFLIQSFYAAVLMRFCMGLIVGVNQTVAPLYLREISPVSISGVIGIMNAGFINMGILSGYLLGLGFPLEPNGSDSFYWRFVLAFPIITSLIRIIGISTVFRKDTPQYYMQHNKFEKAKSILFKIYKDEYKQEIYDFFFKADQKKKSTIDTWSLVFSKNYRSRLVLGCLLQIFRQFTGMNAIIFYSTIIFQNCFGDKQLANYMTVVTGIIVVTFSFLSGFLTKRYGRKPIIIWGQIAIIIALISTGIVSYLSKDQVEAQDVTLSVTILIISLIFSVEIIFSLAIGSITSVYNADIISSEKALGLVSSMNQLSSFVIGLIFPTLQSNFGTYSTFFIFAGLSIIGTIYFQIYLKETRGLQQTQIIDMFEKNNNSINNNVKQITRGPKDGKYKQKVKN